MWVVELNAFENIPNNQFWTGSRNKSSTHLKYFRIFREKNSSKQHSHASRNSVAIRRRSCRGSRLSTTKAKRQGQLRKRRMNRLQIFPVTLRQHHIHRARNDGCHVSSGPLNAIASPHTSDNCEEPGEKLRHNSDKIESGLDLTIVAQFHMALYPSLSRPCKEPALKK